MQVDNATVAWALFLMALSFMSATIAFMYFASKKSSRK